MEKPCTIATCRQCRPGRPCAASARWEAEEAYFEAKDRVIDDARLTQFAQHQPSSFSYVTHTGWAEGRRTWTSSDPMEEDRYS